MNWKQLIRSELVSGPGRLQARPRVLSRSPDFAITDDVNENILAVTSSRNACLGIRRGKYDEEQVGCKGDPFGMALGMAQPGRDLWVHGWKQVAVV